VWNSERNRVFPDSVQFGKDLKDVGCLFHLRGNKLRFGLLINIVIILALIFAIGWIIFVSMPKIQEEKQAVLSFCEDKGFTDVEYTDGISFRNQGFCYKESNGYLEKQGFFVDKQKRVLMVHE